jgi:hypothetical protein
MLTRRSTKKQVQTLGAAAAEDDTAAVELVTAEDVAEFRDAITAIIEESPNVGGQFVEHGLTETKITVEMTLEFMAEQEREQVKALLTQEAPDGISKDDLQDLATEFEKARNMAHVKLLEKFALMTIARAADVQRQAGIDKLALESERKGLYDRVRDLEQGYDRTAQQQEELTLVVGGGAPSIEELLIELEVCEKLASECYKERVNTGSAQAHKAYSDVTKRLQELRKLTAKKPDPAPTDIEATSFAINYPVSSSVESRQLEEASKLQQQAKTGGADAKMVAAAKSFIDAAISQIAANDSSSVTSHITQSVEALVNACSHDMTEDKRILVDSLTKQSRLEPRNHALGGERRTRGRVIGCHAQLWGHITSCFL